MSSIALGIITNHGQPTLPLVIESCLNHVDHIYVVAGTIPAADRPASVDVPDHPKVSLYEVGCMPTKTDLWNVIASLVAPRYDYLLMLDDDEIPQPPEAIRRAVQYMDYDKTVDRLDFPVVNYFGHLDQVATGGMWSQPHRRLWRMRWGYKFTAHRPPCISTEEVGSYFQPLTLHHYSWLGFERAQAKSRFYQRLRPDHEQYGRHMEWFNKIYVPILSGRAPDMYAGFGLHVSETEYGNSDLITRLEPHPRVVERAIDKGGFVFP